MEKRYIKIGHELVAVNEEVYKEYTRWKENLRYLARRDGKCGFSMRRMKIGVLARL